MFNDILQVKKSIVQDENILNQHFHTYTPYTTSFNTNDEIRIAIQSQDLYVLPSESYLFIEFSTAKRDGTAFVDQEAVFSNLFLAHLFSEMRYELNGFELDRSKSPGITTLMKCMIACKSEDKHPLKLLYNSSYTSIVTGTYRLILPLRLIFGFCDDFKKIILNSKHELVLVRNRSNLNLYRANIDILQLTVNKIQWKIPHVSLSDGAKLIMLKTLSKNDNLLIPFRSWDLYELPVVPQTTRHSWSVKTTSQVNKPRYVVIAFQTNRNNVVTNDATVFDNCNISNIKLYLNNERYPYDDMNLNFVENNFHELYHMFSNIQQTYYNGLFVENPVNVTIDDFNMRPLFAFDCSKSDESIKNGMVDVRVEIEAHQNIPAQTTAFCLIIHDNLVQYSPFTSMVRRVI